MVTKPRQVTCRSCRAALFLAICLAAVCAGHDARARGAETDLAAKPAAEARRKRDERRLFQAQELITALPGTWIFKPGETPRIVWRDVETIRRLGADTRLRVRWFDAKLNEFPAPCESGRWLAWIEATAPNGTPFRRALTFYGLPKDPPTSYTPDLTVAMPNFPGPSAPAVLQEHQAEVIRLASEMLPRTVIDSEEGAILLAGLAEFKPLGRSARFVESAAVLRDDCQLAFSSSISG